MNPTTRPEEVTEMDTTNWITTATGHDDCDECLACVDSARSLWTAKMNSRWSWTPVPVPAGITGKHGETYRSGSHSATVARIKG